MNVCLGDVFRATHTEILRKTTEDALIKAKHRADEGLAESAKHVGERLEYMTTVLAAGKEPTTYEFMIHLPAEMLSADHAARTERFSGLEKLSAECLKQDVELSARPSEDGQKTFFTINPYNRYNGIIWDIPEEPKPAFALSL